MLVMAKISSWAQSSLPDSLVVGRIQCLVGLNFPFYYCHQLGATQLLEATLQFLVCSSLCRQFTEWLGIFSPSGGISVASHLPGLFYL